MLTTIPFSLSTDESFRRSGAVGSQWVSKQRALPKDLGGIWGSRER